MSTNEAKPDAHDIVSAMRIAMAHAPTEVQQLATEGLAFEASPAGQTLLTMARGVLASRGFSPAVLSTLGNAMIAALKFLALLAVPLFLIACANTTQTTQAVQRGTCALAIVAAVGQAVDAAAPAGNATSTDIAKGTAAAAAAAGTLSTPACLPPPTP